MLSCTKLASFCIVAVVLGQCAVSALPNSAPKDHVLDSEHPQQFDVETSTNIDVPTFTDCDPGQQQPDINAAIVAAQGYIASAVAYVNQFGGNPPAANDPLGDRYRRWFGDVTPARWNTFTARVAELQVAHLNDWSFNCNEANCHAQAGRILGAFATYAFVDPARRNVAQLCRPFFNPVQSSATKRAHILIHQATRFDAFGMGGADSGTIELYTAAEAWAIAKIPDKALRTANNYAWFARNPPTCDLLPCTIL